MALTFPGAEALVEAVYAQMRSRYQAIPPSISFGDEPAGDFGIAHHYYGSDGELITFDDNRLPVLYVICHELGHAISSNVTKRRGGNGFTNGLYDEFWAARGFPATPWDAQLRAIARENMAVNSGYRLWPEENFADAFGAVNSFGQGTLITETYGAYLDEPRMRAFYASLEGADMALTNEEVDQIASAVSLRILPDILAKLDSGFNTTLPTLLNRQTAGDKDVSTAVKE